jgi:hypothetical protein
VAAGIEVNADCKPAQRISAAMITPQMIVQQLPSANANAGLALGGLLRRKETWRLTAKGWLALLAGAMAVLAIVFLGVHPFLAVTKPVPAEVLVVEGWIPDFALLQAAHEFQAGHYRLLLTIGGPVRAGVNLDPDDTYADMAAKTLKHFTRSDAIVPVPSQGVARDRTYSGALGARRWLAAHRQQAVAINVVTLGVHARRSRLLFEKAFGSDVAVGVIAVPDQDYDQKHWWRYSEGVKEVISESAAYVYARCLFHPPAGD